MNLKEAFRYQNFLEELINETSSYLSYPGNITKTTQQHFRNKANPEAENEEIDSSTERTIAYPVNSIVDFLYATVGAKAELCNAISKAKSSCGVDIDAAIAMNKTRQRVSKVLSTMGAQKARETNREGRAYKFNGEGNQVPYIYDIKEVSTIDYDRNKVKSLSKALATVSDDVSTHIDKIMVDLTVEYDAPYDVNDSFEDVLDRFMKTA